MAQNETSPFAPIFFLAYKKESIDYFSSVLLSAIIKRKGNNVLSAMRLLPSLKEWFLVTGYSSMAAYITKLDVTLFRLKTQTVFTG